MWFKCSLALYRFSFVEADRWSNFRRRSSCTSATAPRSDRLPPAELKKCGDTRKPARSWPPRVVMPIRSFCRARCASLLRDSASRLERDDGAVQRRIRRGPTLTSGNLRRPVDQLAAPARAIAVSIAARPTFVWKASASPNAIIVASSRWPKLSNVFEKPTRRDRRCRSTARSSSCDAC